MTEGHSERLEAAARQRVQDPQPDWLDALADRFWARWRLWVVLVVLVFALNSFAGLLAGGLGLIAFANRVAGRALKARRLVEQARQIVADSDDRA